METWEMCFVLSVNTSRLKNLKKHLRSARKLVTELEKEHYGNLGNVFQIRQG